MVYTSNWTTRLSRNLMSQLIDKFGLKIFVETGTNWGETVRQVSQFFEQVYTVEINKSREPGIRENIKNCLNVNLTIGNSTDFLARLLPLEKPALFWLDAHYSGPATGMGNTECPILEELRIIAPHRASHVFIIDDARMFFKHIVDGHNINHWPHKDEIREVLKDWKGFEFQQIDDAFVITPAPFAL